MVIKNAAYLRVPSGDDYSFITENSDVVKIVTISPELQGAEKMVRDLNNCGIIVPGGLEDAVSENRMIDLILNF